MRKGARTELVRCGSPQLHPQPAVWYARIARPSAPHCATMRVEHTVQDQTWQDQTTAHDGQLSNTHPKPVMPMRSSVILMATSDTSISQAPPPAAQHWASTSDIALVICRTRGRV